MRQKPSEEPRTRHTTPLTYPSAICKLPTHLRCTTKGMRPFRQLHKQYLHACHTRISPVFQIFHLSYQHSFVQFSRLSLTSFSLSSSFCSVCLDTSTSMICCRRASFSSSALTRFSSTLSSSWCSLTETSLATWSEKHKHVKRIHEEQHL